MNLISVIVLAAFLAVAPVHTELRISRPWSRGLLQSATNFSAACAEAISESLVAPNTTWRGAASNASVLQEQFVEIVKGVLAADQRCNSTSTSSYDTLAVTWTQYPSWLNGMMVDCLVQLRDNNATASSFTHFEVMQPDVLPLPAAVTTSSNISNYVDKDFIILSSDMSGFALSSLVDGATMVTENACVDKGNPQGPLFPRTFLLLFYRADVLATMYDAGQVSSADPPADWDSLLAVLKAHAAARRAASATSGASSSASSASSSSSASLPTYGLCITTDVTCGRLGDVLAAIAASVMQTEGTRQGYLFDLNAPLSTVAPLVNSTGWRYALDLLRRLLEYNAPEYDSAAGSFNYCKAFSPWFADGQCLMTVEWDVAFTWMARGGLPLTAPGALRVAPLPGSSSVVIANTTALAAVGNTSTAGVNNSSSSAVNVSISTGSGSSTSSGSPGSVTANTLSTGGTLLPCTSAAAVAAGACSVSANHDVLYLTSAGQASAVVKAARSAAAKCGNAEAVRLEAAAAAAVKAAAAANAVTAAAVAAASTINRAPYSAMLAYFLYIDYESFGLANLAKDMSRIASNFTAQLDAVWSVRQGTIDIVRQALATLSGTANGTDTAAAAAASNINSTSTNTTSQSSSAGSVNGTSGNVTSGNVTSGNVTSGNVTSASGGATTAITFEGSTFASTPWWVGIGGNGGAIPAAALTPYTDAGFDSAAAKSYLQALWHAINSPNLATDPPSPSMINWYKWALGHSALALRPPQSDIESAATLLVRLVQLVDGAYSVGELRSKYEAAIGATRKAQIVDARVPSSAASATSSGHLSNAMVALVVAGSVLGLLAVLGLVARVLWRRRRERHRDLMGRVRAPRAGPDTTLLISDVQNSTVLWEQLPEDVMDLALKLHHSTFRRLLPRYDGYESGTEGDSFILAFAEPTMAVSFAATCQVDLMLQEWPQELLEHPDAEIVLVDPRDGEAAQQVGVLAGDGRRIAGRTNSVGATSLFAGIAARVRGALLRSATVSPLPSASQLPLLQLPSGLYPALSSVGGGRSSSAQDLGGDSSVHSGNLARVPGRGRSIDAGYLRHGPFGGAGGPAAAAIAASTASRSLSGEVGGPLTSGSLSDLLPTKSVAVCGAPAVPSGGELIGGGGGGPRGVASLAAMLSSPLDSSSGGSRLFAARADRGGGGGFSPLLPTLREAAVAPWVIPPSSFWSAALQAAFPVLAPCDAPASVFGGQALKGPLVVLPSGRVGVLAYRGLRVRMGLHTGLDDPQHIVFNKVASAFKYEGPFAEATKCTIDAAPGGMVVLSSQAFARLRHGVAALGPGGGKLMPGRALDALVLYGGHHVMMKPLPPSSSTAGKQQGRPSSASAGGAGAGLRNGSGVRFSVAADAMEEAALEAEAREGGPAEGTALYQAVPSALVCRLALSSGLVSKRVVQLSSLAAPIGCVTVAFMYVVGASTLLTELAGPATRALDQFQRLVYRLLGSKGGYLVEGGNGLVLAAFGSPPAAVEWALDCVAGLKKLNWEPELLSHWLCEEVLSVGLARSDALRDVDGEDLPGLLTPLERARESVNGGNIGGGGGGGGGGVDSGVEGCGAGGCGGDEGVSSRPPEPRRSMRHMLARAPSMARLGAMATTRRVLERGLRIKVGLDTGLASHSLNEASGRLGYRGKVMNRASRVAGKAAAGQVVCTDACWRGCLESGPNRDSAAGDGDGDGADSSSECESSIGGLVGISLGKVALKGVSAPVELIQCMRG